MLCLSSALFLDYGRVSRADLKPGSCALEIECLQSSFSLQVILGKYSPVVILAVL